MSDLVRVMVIDDDREDFILIRDLLNDVPGVEYKIDWLSNSAAALEAIKSQSADVYLVDYNLDHLSALDILEELKDCDLKKTIILLTGEGDRSVDVEAMQRGAADFLSKDRISSEILERAIRYCLKRSQDEEKLKEIERIKSREIAANLANNAKSEFLARVSHDIRAPLCAILGFADLALDSETPNDDKSNFISIIKRNGENLLTLLNELLDVSKAEAGQVKLEYGYFNWRRVIAEVIELFKANANSKGIELTCEFPEHLPKYLKSDQNRFRQIMTNLVSNAIKFTSQGMVFVTAALEKADGISEKLEITVRDTGIGLYAAEQEKLFLPFSQANGSVSQKYGGTGLGLHLSRKLARALDGELVLKESSPGVGSTFAFSVPASFGATAEIEKVGSSVWVS